MGSWQSYLKFFGENELIALGLILEYCDLRTIGRIARCSRSCQQLVKKDSIWCKQFSRLSQYMAVNIIKNQDISWELFFKNMIVHRQIFNIDAFTRHGYFFQFGSWLFIIIDNDLYASTFDFTSKEENRLAIRISLIDLSYKYESIMIRSDEYKNILFIYPLCSVLKCKNKIKGSYVFFNLDHYIRKYIELNHDFRGIIQLDKLAKHKKIRIHYGGYEEIGINAGIYISHDDKGLILCKYNGYPIFIFPKNDQPIYRGKPLQDEIDIAIQSYTYLLPHEKSDDNYSPPFVNC